MPPKTKITKEEIIKVGIEIIEEKGQERLNARSIADRLSCSTQPIFSNFQNMADLKKEVFKEVNKIYNGEIQRFIQTSNEKPYKASGLAYINFARNNKNLFKFMFMRDRKNQNEFQEENDNFESIVKLISNKYNIPYEKAKELHFKMWIFIHGIATMLATNYLDIDEDLISNLMTDIFSKEIKI